MILYTQEVKFYKNKMARVHILKWLYKHSPVNFYSITEEGETIIKSINNTSVGYKFNQEFSSSQIDKLRKDIKWFKRLSTIAVLLVYVCLIYCVIFPNYNFFAKGYEKIVLVFFIIVLLMVGISLCNSKLFEKYLISNYGEYEKTHFPSSNSIENQSYKDFKLELVKISILVVILIGGYLWLGSPYEASLNLISRGKYEDAIKMTTLLSKVIPTDAKWYSLRAYARLNTEDYEGAIEDYDRAYLLESDDYKMMNFDNKIYIRYQLQQYQEALDDFDKEIKNAKDDFDRDSFMWDKAQFLYNIEHYKDALKIYNRLIINSEKDNIYLIKSRLYFERAQVYQKLGKEELAQEDMDKVMNLNLGSTFQNPIPVPTLLLNNGILK